MTVFVGRLHRLIVHSYLYQSVTLMMKTLHQIVADGLAVDEWLEIPRVGAQGRAAKKSTSIGWILRCHQKTFHLMR